jgi:cytochrome c oxidase subunit 2
MATRLIEIGLIAASVILLVFIAIPTVRDIWYTHDVPEAEKGNALDVTATGYQWWFKFEYNTEMVKLATGGETPLVTGNELVVPAGRPIRVHLRTIDVIHSFWVPKLAGKVDMIPNRPNFLWFKADRAGYYYGQCAEYCGESHAIMRFRVIALDQPDYDKWLANQKLPARALTAHAAPVGETPKIQFANYKVNNGQALAGSAEFDANPLAAWHKMQAPEAGENAALVTHGRKLFQEKTCVSCHTVRGHEGIGITGPDLTRVGARSTIAAGVLENTPGTPRPMVARPRPLQARQQDVLRRLPRAGRHRLQRHVETEPHAQRRGNQRPRRLPAQPEIRPTLNHPLYGRSSG